MGRSGEECHCLNRNDKSLLDEGKDSEESGRETVQGTKPTRANHVRAQGYKHRIRNVLKADCDHSRRKRRSLQSSIWDSADAKCEGLWVSVADGFGFLVQVVTKKTRASHARSQPETLFAKQKRKLYRMDGETCYFVLDLLDSGLGMRLTKVSLVRSGEIGRAAHNPKVIEILRNVFVLLHVLQGLLYEPHKIRNMTTRFWRPGGPHWRSTESLFQSGNNVLVFLTAITSSGSILSGMITRV